MEYYLKKVDGYMDEFEYVDQDSIYYNSPTSWLWTGILGGCGCGNSPELAELAFKVLEYQAMPHEERDLDSKYSPYYNEATEILAHWFDDKGLTDHGSGIGGSWLTEKGKQVYNSIKRLKL